MENPIFSDQKTDKIMENLKTIPLLSLHVCPLPFLPHYGLPMAVGIEGIHFIQEIWEVLAKNCLFLIIGQLTAKN